MKLTKEERERIIKALRSARPCIKSGTEPFLCYALIWAREKKKINRWDCWLTQDYILHLINPYNSVFDWFRSTQYHVQPPPSWRKYRLAWIDHMIKELSK